MNENPGEMPNPLNPNPAPTPEPTPNTGENVAMQQQIINSQESYSTSVNDTAATTSPVVNNPSERPMEQASPAAASEKKKKTGLIIGIIIDTGLVIIGVIHSLRVDKELVNGIAVIAEILAPDDIVRRDMTRKYHYDIGVL